MKRPDKMDSEAWLQSCIDVARALPLEESIKVDILGGLTILSGLAYAPATISHILSQEDLMDAIMRESSFAQYIMKQAREEGREEGHKEIFAAIQKTYPDIDMEAIRAVLKEGNGKK
jgi:hypothetical protein